MKIVVIGGTGRIGSKVVDLLRSRGNDVIAAAPDCGVNTFTGEGVAAALTNADVVVDVANAPSFEDGPVMEFFQTSTRNLLEAEKAAGVKHHLALSVVGAERLTQSGYMRAKVEQERLIRASGIPYTILHSTQFFEFLASIGQAGASGSEIRLSPAKVQPVAAEDVAGVLAELATEAPRNAIIELAGPEAGPLEEFVRRRLGAAKDGRSIVEDRHARYFGAELELDSLLPGADPVIGATRFESWLSTVARPQTTTG
jgi:uncharacterized protein YbjT (DUF2867 family)